MTPRQKELVRHSLLKVLPMADLAAELFYERLFALDPTLRRLFTHDMKAQGRKLMRALTVAVNAIDRPEELMPLLHGLGARHADYGVRGVDYDTVGSALLWTLERGIGPAFDAETRAAWAALYALVASLMKEGARQHKHDIAGRAGASHEYSPEKPL